MNLRRFINCLLGLSVWLLMGGCAQWQLQHSQSNDSQPATVITEQINLVERPAIIVSSRSPATGLIVVLHGGMGNPHHLQQRLKLAGLVREAGVVVAFLSGTQALADSGTKRLAWNAGGGCCGLPQQHNIDDVAYVKDAVAALSARFAIAPEHVYGVGYSNGAMLLQRLLCETNSVQRGVSLAGSLMVASGQCPAAAGKKIVAIHGDADEHVPPTGGPGRKGITQRFQWRSEVDSQAIFTAAGADYQLIWLPTDHSLRRLLSTYEAQYGETVAAALTRFFELESR